MLQGWIGGFCGGVPCLERKGMARRWCFLLVGLLLGLGLGRPAVAQRAEVEYAKGIVAYDQRDYLTARDHFRTVVALEPAHADGWFYLGLTQLRLGEAAAAVEALEKVRQLAPAKRYVHHPLGVAYFQARRYREALAQFEAAARFDPKKASTQFYLGYTHYLLRHYRQALPFFERARDLDPALAPAAHYYRGLVLFALEDDAAAQEAFAAVREAAPESLLAQNAERYLEALRRRARQQRLLQVEGVVSFQHDDNVILEPNEIEIARQADQRMVFAALGRLLPLRRPPWRLGIEYALFQSKHFRLEDFDIQQHRGRLFARRKGSRLTLEASAEYAFSLLAGERFFGAFSVQPQATLWQSRQLFATFGARFRLSDFFIDLPPEQDPKVRDRDGWTVRGGVDQYVTFLQQRAYLRLGYAFEASRTEGSDWEYDSHQVALGLHLPLWGGVVLDAEGAFARRDYLHVNSFDADPLAILTAADRRARQDDRFTAAVTLTRELGRYFVLSVAYAHTSNLSNLAFFDYRRNIVTVALTGRY
ncbi:MAG: hypothetical protein KatS3mg131_2271 [Candidatus Tectimicrobiota bacterium]|nr:MAG: hypothetical protein KatS3mg131_2271 [Candidatus Tectomicrobia bacterium]